MTTSPTDQTPTGPSDDIPAHDRGPFDPDLYGLDAGGRPVNAYGRSAELIAWETGVADAWSAELTDDGQPAPVVRLVEVVDSTGSDRLL